MWPQALGTNEGLQTTAILTVNVVGLTLLVISVVAYVHAHGWLTPAGRLVDLMARPAGRAVHTTRVRLRQLLLFGQRAFLRYADLQGGVLTNLAVALTRAAEQADASTRRRDPRLG